MTPWRRTTLWAVLWATLLVSLELVHQAFHSLRRVTNDVCWNPTLQLTSAAVIVMGLGSLLIFALILQERLREMF